MVEHILRASLEQNKAVTIIYTSEKGITERNIRVTELHEGYIKAYCYLRQQMRVFKIENILAASWCKKQYKKAI